MNNTPQVRQTTGWLCLQSRKNADVCIVRQHLKPLGLISRFTNEQEWCIESLTIQKDHGKLLFELGKSKMKKYEV